MPGDRYPFEQTIEVAFRDLDAMGHVNNAVYFSYMETLRIKYMAKLLHIKKLHQLPIIVAEATCAYKSPLVYGETVRAGVGVSRFGTKSFDLVYRLETTDGRLAATGKTVQVVYNYQTGQTAPVPDDFKARVRAYQGDWRPL
ncbi:MAG: acyl-CoA thioesterase [Anaerolineae bacterium]